VTSFNIHGITRIELRDICNLPDGGIYRTIRIFDRNNDRHDVSLFADSTDTDALRFDIEKETAA
jgi:hypothetical protein